jgi:hypothetical protein
MPKLIDTNVSETGCSVAGVGYGLTVTVEDWLAGSMAVERDGAHPCVPDRQVSSFFRREMK